MKIYCLIFTILSMFAKAQVNDKYYKLGNKDKLEIMGNSFPIIKVYNIDYENQLSIYNEKVRNIETNSKKIVVDNKEFIFDSLNHENIIKPQEFYIYYIAEVSLEIDNLNYSLVNNHYIIKNNCSKNLFFIKHNNNLNLRYKVRCFKTSVE